MSSVAGGQAAWINLSHRHGKAPRKYSSRSSGLEKREREREERGERSPSDCMPFDAHRQGLM